MAWARMRHDWTQTAHLLCLTANLNRDPKKQRRPFVPREFMPECLAGEEEATTFKVQPATPAQIQLLEQLFPAKKQ